MGKDGWNRSLLGITARFLMLVSAFLLLLCYLSAVVDPTHAWLMSLFGLLYIPLALLNLALLFWAVKRMSKAFLIPLLALLPSVMFIGRYFQFSSGAEEKGEETIKLVTYNVGSFSLGKVPEKGDEQARTACLDSIIGFLKGIDADIICLQECLLPGSLDVTSFFKEVFPGHSSAYYLLGRNGSNYGNVTLSRFPIVGKGNFDFAQSSNQAIYTDLLVGGTKLRVYNCHFESYSISLSGMARSVVGGDEVAIRQTEEKMKKSIIKRPEQVDLIVGDINECPVESIVVGDFNDTPMSYSYFRLTKGKKDAFIEAGKGFGATYSILWPLIRIDYILFPDRMRAVSLETPKLKLSDHYPVVAELNVNEDAE